MTGVAEDSDLARSPDRTDPVGPWWRPAAMGCVTLLFGVTVLVWPQAVLQVMSVLVGLWLLLSGLVRIVTAFRPGRALGQRMLNGAVGVLYGVTGGVCVADPLASLRLLGITLGLAWLLSAAVDGVGALSRPAHQWGLLVVAGVSAAIGLVFLASPASSVRVFVLTVGLGAVVVGAIQIVAGLQMRQAAS